MTKPTKWHVRPARTQISLGIRLREGWLDAQADLSLCWTHLPFCWFCHDAAQLLMVKAISSFDGFWHSFADIAELFQIVSYTLFCICTTRLLWYFNLRIESYRSYYCSLNHWLEIQEENRKTDLESRAVHHLLCIRSEIICRFQQIA